MTGRKFLLLAKHKTQKEDTMKQPDRSSRRRFLQASSLLGLAVAFSPATGEAFADSQSKTIQKEDTMTQGSAAQRGSEQVADKTRSGAAESAT
jgi:hypothetical protein